MEKIIYMAELLGNLHTLFKVLMIVGWVAFVIVFLIAGECGCFDCNESDDCVIKTILKALAIVAIISTFVTVFLPTKKTYLRMNGEKITKELKENSRWKKELPEDMVIELEEWTKENNLENDDSSL
jgi:hypothetical protein